MTGSTGLESAETLPGHAPLSVLVVTDAYPPDCGGSGWSTYALTNALASCGHRVQVIEVGSDLRTGNHRRYDGLQIRQVNTAPRAAGQGRRLGRRDVSFTPVRRAVCDLLRADPAIDVVHGQHLHSGPGAAAAAREQGRAAVVTLRDHWPICLHGTLWWGGADCGGCTTENLTGCMHEVLGLPSLAARVAVPVARRRLRTRAQDLRLAHRLIAVSRDLAERLRRLHPDLDPAVVPNLVHTATAGVRAPLPTVPDAFLLAAGKLSEAKGFARLLPALAAARCPWPLVVAGRGPLRGRMAQQARDSGLQVQFLEWIDGPVLVELLRRARALVMPSAWPEPLSRTILEALSVGTPVLAWPTGGTAEAVEHDSNGWLVTTQNGLRDGLLHLGDDDVRERWSAGALGTARTRFSAAAVLPRVLAVYREAIAEARR